MSQLTLIEGTAELQQYDPDGGLKKIAVANAGERYFRDAKDPTNLCKAFHEKIDAQVEDIIWRDGEEVPSQRAGKQKIRKDGVAELLHHNLPDADPRKKIVNHLRRKFTRIAETA